LPGKERKKPVAIRRKTPRAKGTQMLPQHTRHSAKRHAETRGEGFDNLSDGQKLVELAKFSPDDSDAVVKSFFSERMDAADLVTLIALAVGPVPLNDIQRKYFRVRWHSHLESSLKEYDEKLRAAYIEGGVL